MMRAAMIMVDQAAVWWDESFFRHSLKSSRAGFLTEVDQLTNFRGLDR